MIKVNKSCQTPRMKIERIDEMRMSDAAKSADIDLAGHAF